MAEVGVFVGVPVEVPVVFNTLPDVQNDAIEVGLPKLILRDTETSRLLQSRRTVKSVKNFQDSFSYLNLKKKVKNTLNAEMKFKILFLNKKIFKKNRGSAVSVLYVSCGVGSSGLRCVLVTGGLRL